MPESALREAVPNDFISSHFAVLPNRVPGPVFLRRISASWRLAHPLCGHGLLYRSCIKLDGHSVFKFGSPMTFSKTKEGLQHDPTHHRRCPGWTFNRNPSNILNGFCFSICQVAV